MAAATIFWQFESERSNANVAGVGRGRGERVGFGHDRRRGRASPRSGVANGDVIVPGNPVETRTRGSIRARAVRARRCARELIGGRSVGGGRVASSGGRVPSLTLNILSLLVSPDPPAGASPSLDARTTAANRDGARARRPSQGLARHPCRPAGREGWADSPRATAFADATVAALAAIAVAAVIVIAAEHAGPLFARVSRARAH